MLSRIVDAMLACPFLILAIALAAFLGPDLTNAMIAIGVSTAPRFMRVARAATLDASSNDYVEAARAIGNPGWRVAVRHVLPNIVPPIMVQGTLAIAAAIIAEASLSFLGLGQQPPAPSWGSMLNSAQRFLSQAPWLAVFPGLAIFLVRAVVQPGRRRIARRAGPTRAVLFSVGCGHVAAARIGQIRASRVTTGTPTWRAVATGPRSPIKPRGDRVERLMECRGGSLAHGARPSPSTSIEPSGHGLTVYQWRSVI